MVKMAVHTGETPAHSQETESTTKQRAAEKAEREQKRKVLKAVKEETGAKDGEQCKARIGRICQEPKVKGRKAAAPPSF